MTEARAMLDLAARIAMRAAGDVEPNPMVGCVLVHEGVIVGMGHHRRFGGLHAEAEALADCAWRGNSAKGATAYVTLEPCAHFGKQPPCCDALIRAGVGRVVCARRDPNPVSTGGAEKLAAAGIACEFTGESAGAVRLSDAFCRRMVTGLPWVIAKWAQTIDGRIATRTGASKWISGEASRREVHRLRARVDCVLTAIGTVLVDDPRLTARGVARVRRVARRVVIDPRLELPARSALMETLGDAPLTVLTTSRAIGARPEFAAEMVGKGVEVFAADGRAGGGDEVDLRASLEHLVQKHGVSTVLVEPGPRLLGRLMEQGLADELRVYVGAIALGDELAASAAAGRSAPGLADGRRYRLIRARPLGQDVRLVYGRTGEE